MTSLIGSDDREAARVLIDRFVEGSVKEEHRTEAVCDRATLDAIHEDLQKVEVPDSVKGALLDIFRVLVHEHGCDETNSLLTDRSFLVKSIKLLRGRALISGRNQVELEDLDVLRWMTTFRIPEDVHEILPEIISAVVSPGSDTATASARSS